MGNVSRSEMIFDAEASKAITELQKLASEQRRLKQEMKSAADEANRGSKSHEEALRKQATAYLQNDATIQKYNSTLRRAGTEMQATGVSSGQLNSNMNQLTFAVDDFLTVLQMPGMGLIPALRASANNLSFVLASINPLYGLLPVLATSAITLADSFFSASEAQEQLGSAADNAIKKLEEELRVLRAIGDEDAVRRDLKFTDEATAIKSARADIQAEREAAMRGWLEDQELLDPSQVLFGDALEKAFFAEQERLLNVRKQMGTLGGLVDLSDPTLQQVRDLGKRELEQTQTLRLLEEKREEERAAAERRREEQQRREIERNVRDRLSPFSGALRDAAVKAATEGQSAQQIQQSLMAAFGGRFGAGDQDALRSQFGDIAQAGIVESMLKDQTQLSPEARRQMELDMQIGSMQLGMQEELARARGPKAAGKIRRRFQQDLAPLEVEQMRLELSEQQRRNDERLIQATERSNAILERIATSMNMTAPEPSGPPLRMPRRISRNP